jgi:hypothetical protein
MWVSESSSCHGGTCHRRVLHPGASPPGKESEMPRGTKVDNVYRALLRAGKDKGSAARIAQHQTGRSLATGKKPKRTVR